MRISGDLATVCFLITGIVLRAKVRSLPRTTTYEHEIAEKQEEAIRKLWVVIKWLMFISLSLIAFDFVSFLFTDENTGRLINEPLWLNDLIYCAVRTIAYMAWALPIFYLFWPSIISR
jgi:hypothetical protein